MINNKHLYAIFKIIGKSATGFPKIYYYGTVSKYNALVLELLGPSLSKLFEMHKRTFSLKTILQIAIQTIDRVEFLHGRGLIYRYFISRSYIILVFYKYFLNIYAYIQYVAYTFYRDIKPDNFLIGLNSSHSERKEDKSSTIYMVDLGLVKPYTDDETGRHIPYAENRSICGTLRYIGLNVHMVLRFSAFCQLA